MSKKIEIEENLLKEILESSSEMLQFHLDDYGHGEVSDWGPQMEEELGWGEDCAPYRLGRSIKEIKNVLDKK